MQVNISCFVNFRLEPSSGSSQSFAQLAGMKACLWGQLSESSTAGMSLCTGKISLLVIPECHLALMTQHANSATVSPPTSTNKPTVASELMIQSHSSNILLL